MPTPGRQPYLRALAALTSATVGSASQLAACARGRGLEKGVRRQPLDQHRQPVRAGEHPGAVQRNRREHARDQGENSRLQQVTAPSAFSVSDIATVCTRIPCRRRTSAVCGCELE